jgi:hypothetical protein
MDTDIDELLDQLRKLEQEVEDKLEARRAAFQYSIQRHRVVFEESVRQRHRQIRVGVFAFLRQAPLLNILSAPLVYALIMPIVILDVSVSLYQAICFRIWRIPRVRRRNHIVIDRQHLAYLNGIQKLNCVYCGYANGVLAFVTEIAARTEKFWCPIKHAHKPSTTHRLYRDFLEYGDEADYEKRQAGHRRDLTTDD